MCRLRLRLPPRRTLLPHPLPLLRNPHRFAGFAVLKAPDIPSTLIEIGFLSTPEEEQQILSLRHREKVIQGIVQGITNYFAEAQTPE